MIKIDKKTKEQLIQLHQTKRISLEGNILKVIDVDGDIEFEKYVNESIEKDNATRKKRLEITKQIQKQNKELTDWKIENERIQGELLETLELNRVAIIEAENAKEEAENAKEEAELSKDKAEKSMIEAMTARAEAENAKNNAENDLELIQKKSQFELIGTIVKVALWVIMGVGVTTTVMFLIALFAGVDTSVIGSTWSNIIGILLTNAFSIVGTIMGVKYASEKNQ
jgi:VIT1/CCC1 family predicted Fe2+/Mn2+ transporter